MIIRRAKGSPGKRSQLRERQEAGRGKLRTLADEVTAADCLTSHHSVFMGILKAFWTRDERTEVVVVVVKKE